MPTLSLTIVEIIVLMLGAIVLGITIHFFIVSRRNLRAAIPPPIPKINKEAEEWKMRYHSDMELKDKEIASIRQQLEEERENNNINLIEAEEQRQKNKHLREEIASLQQSPAVDSGTATNSFTEELKLAQQQLMEQNERISRLLGQIDSVTSSQQKQDWLLRENEELAVKVEELELKLLDKDRELNNIRQKAILTKEMSSMLDNAYSEFQVLQEKIQKLEAQAAATRMNSLDLENLKEENSKLSRELEEGKAKLYAASSENQQLRKELLQLDEELKEARFQREQLEKKVSYLEEMNIDLQAVSDANKKLESQIKRIGELESMLNMLAEERDQLMRRQGNP